MPPSRLVLLSFAASLAACGGGATVILGSGPTAPTGAAPASTPPATSASAPRASARVAPCSTTASCKKGEVCCVSDDPSAPEFCAAWSKPESEGDLGASSNAACAGAAPPASRASGDTIYYKVLECSDSGDCGADELCVLGARASAASLASCVKKKAAAGSKEVCGRGTCRAARTACEKHEIEGLRMCEPTTSWPCGATACKFPEICCAGRLDSHCRRYACSKMEGPAWACSARAHCGEGQVCCLSTLGHMGSQCVFSCDGEMQAPTCTKDADCPEIMGRRSKCMVVQDSPVEGVMACQVP
jgi:hypothetical protein